MTERMSHRRTLVRRLIGLGIAVFGVFALFGGLFVPLDVIVSEPRIVPAPESYVAIWIAAMGVLIASWPRRRDETR